MFGISPKNLDILLKHLMGLHNHLQKRVILFKPKMVDVACVQAYYLEKIGHNKGKSSGSKHKEHQKAYTKGKKSWKGGKTKREQPKYACAKIPTTTKSTAIFISI